MNKSLDIIHNEHRALAAMLSACGSSRRGIGPGASSPTSGCLN
jgi:hypothetical protein